MTSGTHPYRNIMKKLPIKKNPRIPRYNLSSSDESVSSPGTLTTVRGGTATGSRTALSLSSSPSARGSAAFAARSASVGTGGGGGGGGGEGRLGVASRMMAVYLIPNRSEDTTARNAETRRQSDDRLSARVALVKCSSSSKNQLDSLVTVPTVKRIS